MHLRLLFLTLVIIQCSNSKKVRLVGVAMDAKYSAMVWDKNNKATFLVDKRWSNYYLNEKVIIKGIIDTVFMRPDTINGTITQSMNGAIPVIKDAKIRRCFLCRVKKEEILDKALGKGIRQK